MVAHIFHGVLTGSYRYTTLTDVTHDLRHAAASMMISAGANALVVQRQLGHSSAKMTLDKYSHLFDSDLDDIIDAFPQDRGIVV